MLPACTYTLTVELDDSCRDLPVAAQHRTYRAELEDRGCHYLLVGLLAGGNSEATQLGELFSGELSLGRSSEPQLKWNNVDTGCDIAEPLGNSGGLATCGQGAGRAQPVRARRRDQRTRVFLSGWRSARALIDSHSNTPDCDLQNEQLTSK